MSDLQYRAPAEFSEAAGILAEYGTDAKVLAGGTTLLLLMKQQLASPRVLVSLHRLPGLSAVTQDNDGLHLGAQTTLRDLEVSQIVARRFPSLRQTLAQVASVRIRNQATIGGNVAYGDPLMDLPATLMALDASVHLLSSRGGRTVHLTNFFVDHLTTVAQPDEIITGISVPFLPPRSGTVYLKYLARTAADYGTVGVAVRLSLEAAGDRVADVRIALAGVGPTTVRPLDVEAALRGQPADRAAFATVAAAVRSAVSPSSDSRGSAEYKRHMVEVFLRRALDKSRAEVRDDFR